MAEEGCRFPSKHARGLFTRLRTCPQKRQKEGHEKGEGGKNVTFNHENLCTVKQVMKLKQMNAHHEPLRQSVDEIRLGKQ